MIKVGCCCEVCAVGNAEFRATGCCVAVVVVVVVVVVVGVVVKIIEFSEVVVVV
jgi:hypothetical protein